MIGQPKISWNRYTPIWALLLASFYCSSIESMSVSSSKKRGELTQSLSFHGSDLLLDALDAACPPTLTRVDLREQAKLFTEEIKKTIKKEVLIDVSYCHLYEAYGLWYCRMEAQASKKMTRQVAEFAIVKTVEVFLRELNRFEELFDYLRLEPVSTYHLQLVINAPDEPGYVGEASTWNSEVSFRTESESDVMTLETLYKKVYPNKEPPKSLDQVMKKSTRGTQELLSNALIEEQKSFWSSKGYLVDQDTWGYISRFRLPKNSPHLFLHLRTSSHLKEEMLKENQEHNIEYMIENFEKLLSDWKQWLLEKQLVSRRELEENPKFFSLVWRHPLSTSHRDEVRLFNIGDKVFLYSPRHSIPKRFFSFFRKKHSKEYFCREISSKASS